MSKTLLIVESPAKAKTIGKYLGAGYDVVASVGHIRDLPKSSKKAIDIEAGFVPHYEISAGKEHVVADIKARAAKAARVILAPDPDREGEAIAWHIAEAAKLKHPERVTFHEITKSAIEEALRHPRQIDQHLRQAQEARRVLDRLVGYDLSGLLWKKIRYGLSAGRVQTPALRIIAEREKEIRAFVPETYFTISAEAKTKGGETLALACDEEPRDRATAEKILAAAQRGPWKIDEVKETEVARAPKPPFTTSTLQQAASTRLGFSPSRTMQLAQRLYEAGHITYMRTDSVNLSKEATAQMAVVVKSQFGAALSEPRAYVGKAKNAQEAHEAIRPSQVGAKSAGADADQKRLYQLIWARAIASQMADAKTLRTKIAASCGAGLPAFSANGSRVLSPGWLLADPDARGEDVELPKVAAGDTLDAVSATLDEKQTTPPARYSEAGLVRELEKRGIGRPSTYASIIKTLVDREYATREARSLAATDLGIVVADYLGEKLPEYAGDELTAQMEEQLDEIAEGAREYAPTLSAFYERFQKDLGVVAKEKSRANDLGEGAFACPDCSGPTVVKLGRTGKFLSCANFPTCRGALREDGTPLEKPEPKSLGLYPETGETVYLLDGRFGPYVQVGEAPAGKQKKDAKKPRRASVPKDLPLEDVTLGKALKWLELPRDLGANPANEKAVVATIGRFGPYVGCDGEFRSIKAPLDVYTITLAQALELLAQPKAKRGGWRKKKATQSRSQASTRRRTDYRDAGDI
jgi:DNA topoisomerase-1